MGVGRFCIQPNTMVYCAIQAATVTCAIQLPIQLSPFNGELKYLLQSSIITTCIPGTYKIRACYWLPKGPFPITARIVTADQL